MDNIKATNDCGIYLDEFCNRETLNIDKKYLTAEEARQAAIIEIANKHSYYCFGKSIKDILIEAGYLQSVNNISLWD